MKPTHGELFAGIGGFGLAFDQAGFETKWHVEIDKNCQEVLRKRFPDTQIFDDVCEVGKHNLVPVDVITFGSPCQDLSIAGKRKGLIDGTRSNLFFEAIRIVGELKPAFAVWENVPGALSSNSGRDFASVLGAFQDIGARDIAWRIFDAQYFGVPQRRRRIFLVADFRGERAAEVLFESEGMFGDIAKGGKEGEGVAQTIAGGSNKCHSDITSGQQDGNLIAVGHSGGATLKINKLVNTLTGQTGSETTAMFNGVATSRTLRGGKEGGGKGYLGSEELGMTLGGQPQYVGIRRLTPTECARLQGFPDDWNDWLSDSARYRQFGNAVAVPVVKWIADRIIKYA